MAKIFYCMGHDTKSLDLTIPIMQLKNVKSQAQSLITLATRHLKTAFTGRVFLLMTCILIFMCKNQGSAPLTEWCQYIVLHYVLYSRHGHEVPTSCFNNGEDSSVFTS